MKSLWASLLLPLGAYADKLYVLSTPSGIDFSSVSNSILKVSQVSSLSSLLSGVDSWNRFDLSNDAAFPTVKCFYSPKKHVIFVVEGDDDSALLEQQAVFSYDLDSSSDFSAFFTSPSGFSLMNVFAEQSYFSLRCPHNSNSCTSLSYGLGVNEQMVKHFGKPKFTMNDLPTSFKEIWTGSAEEEQFLRDFSVVKQFTEESEHVADGQIEMILLPSLKTLKHQFGASSLIYQSAASALAGEIANANRMIQSGSHYEAVVSVMYTGNAAMKVAPSPKLHSLSRREVSASNYTGTLGTCYTDADSCMERYLDCSGRGTCQERGGCFVCKCESPFTGITCQLEDVSFVFNIVFWTSLAMVLTLIATIVAVATIDPGSDTLLYRLQTGRQKMN